MNLKHAQLDPRINRTRRKPGDLASPARKPHGIPQPSANPENPYVMTHIGLFTGSVEDEKGNDRPYALYVPSIMKTSGNSMIVFVPGGECPVEFLKKGMWKESLERHAIAAYFIGAPDGWRADDPGFEIDAATKVMAEMRSMEYFPYNAPGVYCMGLGDGANIASVFSIMHISVLAAWAAWGNTELDSELIELIGNAPSDCDAGLRKSDIPLPTFIVDSNESNTVRFFKKACKAKDEYLHNGFARVFRQRPKPGESYINDQACSEVWHSTFDDAAIMGRDVMIEKMVAFLEDYKRWGGEGNGHIRRTQRPEDIGMIKAEATIDGLKRYWYTFEPTAYKRGSKDKYPLVIAIHGFSCSGEYFAENSGWHHVGEERGAFVVYPTAYPFDRSIVTGRFGPNIAATPHWNALMFTVDADPQGPDDISFFKQMLAIVENTYPIDRERIYVTGHSNGSIMAQRLARFWPQKFAGFAPVGAMECRNEAVPQPDDGYLRNVWFTMGEFDGDGCSLEEGTPNYVTVNNLCAANRIDSSRRRYYETGIYMHTVIRDERGVPLVRFTGVKNWPHTYSPELAFLIYDEFFSRFVRHADGALEYLA